jgi:predicted Zn-dependent protease
MTTLTVTIELPEALYQSAIQTAQATNRSFTAILQESLARTIPPLEDLPPAEARELARLSLLNDDELWRISTETLSPNQQIELETLLTRQGAGELPPNDQERLQELMDRYGQLLVQRAHAWLLLARRGYRVPVQETTA